MRRLARGRIAARRLKPVRWGSFRRTTPISDVYGFDRGTPVDRHYIHQFIHENAAAITGEVLEVHDSSLTQKYGRNVISAHVLDIDERNPHATVITDLARELPEARFDCFLLIQTLQYVSDQAAALRHAIRSLRGGGTLLLTVPAISRIDPTFSPDLWRYTEEGLHQLLSRAAPDSEIKVASFGNPLAAVAFLMGLAAEEMSQRELSVNHPSFPIVITARVVLKDHE